MNTISNPIKIALADDHYFFRNGFKRIIKHKHRREIEFVAEASNGLELIDCVALHQPDIVITDIKMPKLDGIQACRIIKSRFPKTGIMALSMCEDPCSIMQMLQAGASAYLVKNSTSEEVYQGIKNVRAGKPYYCSTISEKIFNQQSVENSDYHHPKKTPLTVQEIKVIQLICQQKTTKEIAGELELSTRTVENYRHHIQEKIGAKNSVGVAFYALLYEIVSFGDILTSF